MRIVRSELLKLLGLPSAWAALAVSLVVAPVIAFLNSSTAVRAIQDGTATSTVHGVGFWSR